MQVGEVLQSGISISQLWLGEVGDDRWTCMAKTKKEVLEKVRRVVGTIEHKEKRKDVASESYNRNLTL